MINPKNFDKIEEFEKSLITPKKHLNKSKPISNNITSNEEEYTQKTKEINGNLNNSNLSFKNIETIDTELKTKKKEKTNKVEDMFQNVESENSNTHTKDKNNISTKKVVTDVLKATTLNPISVLKAASTVNKYKNQKKKKKSKFKKLLIIGSLGTPLFIVFTYVIMSVYIIFFTSSSSMFSPSQIIQMRYSKLLKDGEIGLDIVQKFDSGRTEDTSLPTQTENETTTESDLYLKVTTSSVPYYSQHDPRWKDKTYCPGETYSQSACGPASLAMLLTHIKYTELDTDGDGITLPTDTAEYSLKHNFATTLGTDSTLFYTLPNLKGEYLSPSADLDRIKELLGKGIPLIYSVNGSKTFAYSHLMVATGYKDGQWTVNDPNNYDFSNKTWSESEFLSGAYYFVYIHK